jgi:hypothetical protein
MKVYRASDENNADIPKEHRKKIALLKLAEPRVIVKGVGMRENDFYLVIENDKDREYLDLKLIIDGKMQAFDILKRAKNIAYLYQYIDIQKSIAKQKSMLS